MVHPTNRSCRGCRIHGGLQAVGAWTATLQHAWVYCCVNCRKCDCAVVVLGGGNHGSFSPAKCARPHCWDAGIVFAPCPHGSICMSDCFWVAWKLCDASSDVQFRLDTHR
eukprot:PhF_6_TR5519/c0_g1_i2/m.7835